MGSPAELAQSGGIYAELLKLTQSTSAADRRRLKKSGFVSGHASESEEEEEADV